MFCVLKGDYFSNYIRSLGVRRVSITLSHFSVSSFHYLFCVFLFLSIRLSLFLLCRPSFLLPCSLSSFGPFSSDPGLSVLLPVWDFPLIFGRGGWVGFRLVSLSGGRSYVSKGPNLNLRDLSTEKTKEFKVCDFERVYDDRLNYSDWD